MTKVLDIQAEDYEKTIKSDIPVAIEFWIKSCGNCKKFKPIYERLAELFGDNLRFTRINMFESVTNLRLAEGLGVEVTPTVKIFCKSEEIDEIVGFKPMQDGIVEIEKIIIKSSRCKE
jgi:thioredoxin 1